MIARATADRRHWLRRGRLTIRHPGGRAEKHYRQYAAELHRHREQDFSIGTGALTSLSETFVRTD